MLALAVTIGPDEKCFGITGLFGDVIGNCLLVLEAVNQISQNIGIVQTLATVVSMGASNSCAGAQECHLR